MAIDEVLMRAQQPDDLAKRIANAKRGIFDDEADVERKREGRRRMVDADEANGTSE